MRYLLIFFFTLIGLVSFAQQSALDDVSLEQTEIRFIVRKLNVLLKDSLIRGRSYGKTFGMLYDDKSDISYVDSTIRTVLKDHKVIKGGYNVHVYWDHYSDEVYSSLAKSAEIEIGTFPNYDNYEASPNGGYRKLMDSLKVDLLDLFRDEDWYTSNRGFSCIEVFVDKFGNSRYLINNRFYKLKHVSNIKWSPALYFGEPTNNVIRINFKRKYKEGKVSDIEFETGLGFGISFLAAKYSEKTIRFESRKSENSRGNMVVSFVYNAESKSFENPKIHQGDIKEAKEFIRWLEAYSFSNHVFHWKDWPESNRYYFYYN